MAKWSGGSASFSWEPYALCSAHVGTRYQVQCGAFHFELRITGQIPFSYIADPGVVVGVGGVGGVDGGDDGGVGVGGVDGGGVGLVGGRERGQGQAWNILSLQHSATLQYSGCNSLQLEHSATLGLQTSAPQCNTWIATQLATLHNTACNTMQQCNTRIAKYTLYLYLHFTCICTTIVFVFAVQRAW